MNLNENTRYLAACLFALAGSSGAWGCGDGGACEGPLCGEMDGSMALDASGPEDGGATPHDAGVEPPQDAGGPVTSCEELVQSGGCPENRACTETPLGPRCELWCEAGYEAESLFGPCAPCAASGCTGGPACEAGGPVPGQCAVEQRMCIDRDNGPACGDCLEGFAEDPATGRCLARTACGEMECALGEFAVPDALGAECACVPAPCAPGDALDPGGACVSCGNLLCGTTPGGVAPYGWTDGEGRCICMVEEGWYWPTDSSRVPKECDQDGDDWMAASAWDAWSADGAIGEVTRAACRPHIVDRVSLVNEYGQERTLYLCEGNAIRRAPCDTMDPAEAVLRLPRVESDRNDRAQLIAAAAMRPNTTVVPYGYGPADGPTAGRLPLPSELNSLTKSCILGADYNDDGTEDVAEAQPSAPERDLPGQTDWELWRAFAYFMELHTSGFVAEPEGGPSAPGRLVIREVSRCEDAAEFPLGYADPGDLDYWRSCHRQPDARYNPETVEPGFDFGQWSCDTPGTCSMAPFPDLLNLGTPVSHGAVFAGAYGLCASHGAPGADPIQWGDTDEAWRGMHHHSQFKCVSAVPTSDPASQSWVRDHASFNPSTHPETPGHLDFQRCYRAGDALVCDRVAQADLPQVETVGWAAIRHDSPILDGVAGCIDEALWEGLCVPVADAGTGSMPGPDVYHGDRDNFGALLACGPVIYLWGPEAGAGDLPPERTLVWGQGRWE